MARGRSRPDDSLELLLDTICNTFGGVLFIAILVVVLLQSAGRRPPEEAERTAPEDLQALTIRLSQLRAELISLQQARAGQDDLTARFAPEETRHLIDARRELRTSIEELSAEHDQLLVENANQRVDIEEAKREVAEAVESLQSSRKEVARLEEQIREQRQARVQEVRMPVVRSAGLKSEVGLILRYGRMYVWHRYDRFGNRLGLNTDEFVVVEDRGDELVTQPNPAAGIPLNGEDATKRRLRDRLRQFRPQNVYMVVVARPDSFAQFRFLRDVLIEMGFEYRLMPAEQGVGVVDRGGRGGRVQ